MTELSKEPGLRGLPIPHHGLRRDVQDIRRFLNAEATEESQFHDLAHSRVENGQFRQRIAQRDEIGTLLLSEILRIVEGHSDHIPTTLLPTALPCEFHQEPTHRLRGDGEEVRAVLPLDPVYIDEPDIGFVDKRRGLKRVTGPFVPHVPSRENAQLSIDERHEPFKGRFVALAPRHESKQLQISNHVRLARKALELDDTLGEAHNSFAAISADFCYECAEAERHFKRAIELSPNYETALGFYATYLAYMGRHEEALTFATRARPGPGVAERLS